jgi:MFS family permease
VAIGYCFALGGMIFGSWAGRLADVKEQVGAAPGLLGLAMLGTAAGSLTSMLLASRLIGRFGPRRLLVAAGTLMCLSLCVAASSTSLVHLAVGLTGMGLGSGSFAVCFGLLAVDYQQRAGRPLVTRFHGCHSAGGLAGAIIGVVATETLSPAVHLGVLALVGIVGLWVMAPALPDADRFGASGASTTVITPALLTVGFVAACAAFGEGSVVGWAAVYLREQLHAPAALVPLGFAAQALCMVVVRSTGPQIFARWGISDALMRAGVLTALGATLVAFAPVPLIAIVGFGAIGAGVANVFPTVTALAGRTQPGAGAPDTEPVDEPARLALGMNPFALAVLLGASGSMLSGPTVGLISQVSTLRLAFVVVALAGVGVALLAPRLVAATTTITTTSATTATPAPA